MKTRAGGPDRHGRVPAVTEVVIDRRHRAVWKSCVFSRSRKAQELALHAPNLWRLLDQRERRDTEEERRARQPPDLRCFAEPLVPPEREGAPRAPTLVDPIRSINPGGQTTGRASLRRILSVGGACASFGPERADHARALDARALVKSGVSVYDVLIPLTFPDAGATPRRVRFRGRQRRKVPARRVFRKIRAPVAPGQVELAV